MDDKLMDRIDHAIYDEALTRKGCREMDFTGRPMKGYVFAEPKGIDSDKDLEYGKTKPARLILFQKAATGLAFAAFFDLN